MKKLVCALLAMLISAAAFAQDATPEMLKKKELFEKTDLFEPQSIFTDKAANAALLQAYEADKAAYKPSQLLPIAVCYLSFGDLVKSKDAFEAFLKASPKNIRAIRTLGTIALLSKDNDKAVEYYKQAIKLGDERSVVFLGSAYIMGQKPDEIKAYLEPLKKQAKENLEAFNVLMLYAMRDRENPDKDLMKSAISGMDARKIILSATPDGFSTVLRIYLASRDLWTPSALVVPARAAALMETWLLARDCYRKALEADPNDKLALRGMGLVEYRTGDVSSAANYIKSAYEKGEKDAATDGIELFLLSNRADIWDMFKPMVKDATLSPQIRAGLVQYAANNGGQPDMFYTAAIGPEAELLYKDVNVMALLKMGVEKYASDKRSAEVVKLIQAAEKNGKK